MWDDWPRQRLRSIQKKLGFPASEDVGKLASVIRGLKEAAEKQVAPYKVTSAVVGIPHIPALYEEDVADAVEYVGMEYFTVKNWFRPMIWETAIGYAGYAQGLCSNYKDISACHEEQSRMPNEPILAVSYTANALTMAWPLMHTAFGLWEPTYRMKIKVDLGSDNKTSLGEDYYWRSVRYEFHELFSRLRTSKPEAVIVMGDQADDEMFQKVIDEAAAGFGTNPNIFKNDSTFAAAKGAAEFMKRSPYRGSMLQSMPQETAHLDHELQLMVYKEEF